MKVVLDKSAKIQNDNRRIQQRKDQLAENSRKEHSGIRVQLANQNRGIQTTNRASSSNFTAETAVPKKNTFQVQLASEVGKKTQGSEQHQIIRSLLNRPAAQRRNQVVESRSTQPVIKSVKPQQHQQQFLQKHRQPPLAPAPIAPENFKITIVNDLAPTVSPSLRAPRYQYDEFEEEESLDYPPSSSSSSASSSSALLRGVNPVFGGFTFNPNVTRNTSDDMYLDGRSSGPLFRTAVSEIQPVQQQPRSHQAERGLSSRARSFKIDQPRVQTIKKP
jgi:hypothetical protein